MSKKKKNGQVENGLSDVVMGGMTPFSMATQINQTDTFFYNIRTYLISNMRQLLSQMYVEHGIIQALIDTPVEDALRGGFKIKTSMLDEEEITELENYMEECQDIETVKQAFKWMRLYGGGGIIIMTNQKHDKPLDDKKLDGMELRAVDMWELFSAQQNIDDDTRRLEIGEKSDFCFNYYAINLHKTRVIVLKGKVAPSFIRPRLRGWGFSYVEAVVSSINQFLKSKNLTFEVLDEFKVDIFKIAGLNQALLQKDGTAKVTQRVQLANSQKNFQNAMVLDAQDEHQSKQLTFSGLADVQKEFRIQLASDLRMPLTKLFGLSATGFNSGDDDIENYNGMIESEVRPKIKAALKEVIKLRIKEKYGVDATDLKLELHPLRTLSHEQEENVKDKKFNRVVISLEKGLCSHKEAQEAINREGLLGVKIEASEGIDQNQDG